MLKVGYFLHEIMFYKNPQNPRSFFFLASKYQSIISMYYALNSVFKNRLFQLNEETSCLLST